MITQFLTSIRAIDKASVKKSGGVAVILGVGVNIALLSGVAIPLWGQLIAPLVGVAVYKLLPKPAEAEVDAIVNDAIDIVTAIPQTYSAPTDFPAPHDGAFAPPETPATNNLNK